MLREIVQEISTSGLTPIDFYSWTSTSKDLMKYRNDPVVLDYLASEYHLPKSDKLSTLITLYNMPMHERLARGDLEYVEENLMTVFEIHHLLEYTKDVEVFKHCYYRLRTAMGLDSREDPILTDEQAHNMLSHGLDLEELDTYTMIYHLLREKKYQEAINLSSVHNSGGMRLFLEYLPEDLLIQYILDKCNNELVRVLVENNLSDNAAITALQAYPEVLANGIRRILDIDNLVIRDTVTLIEYILRGNYDDRVILRSTKRDNSKEVLAAIKIRNNIVINKLDYSNILRVAIQLDKLDIVDNILKNKLPYMYYTSMRPMSSDMLYLLLDHGITKIDLSRIDYDHKRVIRDYPVMTIPVLEDLAGKDKIIELPEGANSRRLFKIAVMSDSINVAKALYTPDVVSAIKVSVGSILMLKLCLDEFSIPINSIDLEGDDVISEAVRIGYTGYKHYEDSMWELQDNI